MFDHWRVNINTGDVPDDFTTLDWVTLQWPGRNGHTPVADFGLWGEVLERAWHWIFGQGPIFSVSRSQCELPLAATA